MDSTSLMLSLLFGCIGMGFLAYGKNQWRLPRLVAGLALMTFPYFIPNPIALLVVGAFFTGLPFALRDY